MYIQCSEVLATHYSTDGISWVNKLINAKLMSFNCEYSCRHNYGHQTHTLYTHKSTIIQTRINFIFSTLQKVVYS